VSRRTYRYGGLTLIDCPCCGQAARPYRRGKKTGVRCYGGCPEDEVLAALARGQEPPPPPSTPIAPITERGFAFAAEQIESMRRQP
jgi:hypothetical protein